MVGPTHNLGVAREGCGEGRLHCANSAAYMLLLAAAAAAAVAAVAVTTRFFLFPYRRTWHDSDS